MINLDQVRTLEWKVKQAVQLIVHLRRENDTLRGRLSDAEVRIQELESLLESFKANQNEMESGIRSALEELDHLEGAAEVSSETVGPVESFVLPSATESLAEESAVEVVVETPVVEEVSIEEAPLVEESVETGELSEDAELFEAPSSVELEESSVPEETVSNTPVLEEREPEQPGLGIF